jgi:hypothetical protein
MTQAAWRRGAAGYRIPAPRMADNTANDIGDLPGATLRLGRVAGLGVAAILLR